MSDLMWVLRLAARELDASSRRRLLLAVLLGAGATGAAVALTGTSAWLIVRASEQPPVLHLMVAIVGVRAFGLSRGVLRYGERLAGHDASLRALTELRVSTVRRLADLVPAHLPTHDRSLDSGSLLAGFVDDVDGLTDLWARVVLPVASTALVVTGATVAIGVISPHAALVLLISVLAAGVLAPWWTSQRTAGVVGQVSARRAAYEADVVEVLSGATELTLYGALGDRLAGLDGMAADIAAVHRRRSRSGGWAAALAALAAGGSVWAALAIGARSTMSSESLTVMVLMPLAVHEAVAALVPALHALPALAGSAARVRRMHDLADPVREPAAARALPEGMVDRCGNRWRPVGVRVDNLDTSWGPASPMVIEHLTLDIAPGEFVVVTGASGQGKSTLASVLARLLEPVRGAVVLSVGSQSPVSMAVLSTHDVRRVVGLCPQDPHVFDSTVAANLRFARPEATDDDLRRALDRALLGEWLAALPDGLDTHVGAAGRAVSGGEAQRLGVARALLADRPVMVFDEPTEHLDDDMAAELARRLLDLAGDHTVIVLTHRGELFPHGVRVVDLGSVSGATTPFSDQGPIGFVPASRCEPAFVAPQLTASPAS
jgi:thiol reductant ABC exporter CydC subunit